MSRGHRTAELRSIALHRLVAARLDEAALKVARDRVERWIADGGPVGAEDALRWRELLRKPPAIIAQHIVEDTEEMRDLRQNTPFAGVLSNRERWRVVAEVR